MYLKCSSLKSQLSTKLLHFQKKVKCRQSQHLLSITLFKDFEQNKTSKNQNNAQKSFQSYLKLFIFQSFKSENIGELWSPENGRLSWRNVPLQVHLNEIDALFYQISQNMTAKYLSDCPSFDTNLRKLFCQFISCTICVNSGKYMDNFWTITCHIMA